MGGKSRGGRGLGEQRCKEHSPVADSRKGGNKKGTCAFHRNVAYEDDGSCSVQADPMDRIDSYNLFGATASRPEGKNRSKTRHAASIDRNNNLNSMFERKSRTVISQRNDRQCIEGRLTAGSIGRNNDCNSTLERRSGLNISLRNDPQSTEARLGMAVSSVSIDHRSASQSIGSNLEHAKRASHAGTLNAERGRKGNQAGLLQTGTGWRLDDICRPTPPNVHKKREVIHSGSGRCRQQQQRSCPKKAAKVAPEPPPQCLICTEDLDTTDMMFQPCPCGYQVCLFCHHRIRLDTGQCPMCRGPYKTITSAKPVP